MSLAPASAPDLDASFDAAGVALLMPAASGPEIAVLLPGPDAPIGISLELSGRCETFLRMRQGPLVHGMIEPYREGWDSGDIAFVRITADSHEPIRLGNAGRLFGSRDALVLIPRSAGRTESAQVTLPINPIGAARRAVLRPSRSSIEPVYEFVDEVDDPGWVCPVCGRMSPNPEPHTAEHGVPGHLIAGMLPGERLDETSGYSAR